MGHVYDTTWSSLGTCRSQTNGPLTVVSTRCPGVSETMLSFEWLCEYLLPDVTFCAVGRKHAPQYVAANSCVQTASVWQRSRLQPQRWNPCPATSSRICRCWVCHWPPCVDWHCMKVKQSLGRGPPTCTLFHTRMHKVWARAGLSQHSVLA